MEASIRPVYVDPLLIQCCSIGSIEQLPKEKQGSNLDNIWLFVVKFKPVIPKYQIEIGGNFHGRSFCHFGATALQSLPCLSIELHDKNYFSPKMIEKLVGILSNQLHPILADSA